MNCQKCRKPIPQDEFWNTDNGLDLYFDGGYGEFYDSLIDGPFKVQLCHECAHDLADWLGLDVHNWHTHRVNGTQHPDHHDLDWEVGV